MCAPPCGSRRPDLAPRSGGCQGIGGPVIARSSARRTDGSGTTPSSRAELLRVGRARHWRADPQRGRWGPGGRGGVEPASSPTTPRLGEPDRGDTSRAAPWRRGDCRAPFVVLDERPRPVRGPLGGWAAPRSRRRVAHRGPWAWRGRHGEPCADARTRTNPLRGRGFVERTTGFEPATLTLARLRRLSGWSRLVLRPAAPSGQQSVPSVDFRRVVARSTTTGPWGRRPCRASWIVRLALRSGLMRRPGHGTSRMVTRAGASSPRPFCFESHVRLRRRTPRLRRACTSADPSAQPSRRAAGCSSPRLLRTQPRRGVEALRATPLG